MARDKRSDAEKAVDDFKGQQQARVDKNKLLDKATGILEQAREEQKRGLEHYTEDEELLCTPEEVMQHLLAGHPVHARKPMDDEPLKVSKGTVTEPKK